MKIRTVRLRQSGGFAGLVRSAEIDATELPAEDVRALANVAEAPASDGPATPRGRDLMTYELEIDTDHGTLSLRFDEESVPAKIASVVRQLAKRTKPAKLR